MIAAWNGTAVSDGFAAWNGLGHWDYLALMSACVLVTLPLEFAFSARVYRRLPLLLKALLPVVVVFAAWDIAAIARDHWTYDPRFVTGIGLGVLPLEELVFFLVIPICALLSYEAVGTLIGRARRRTARGKAPADGNLSRRPPPTERSPTRRPPTPDRRMEGTPDDP